MRISGVSVGKVKSIVANPHTGNSDVDDRAPAALRADPARHARDPAPEDAARRDLRRADARPAEPPAVPDGGRAGGPAGRADASSSTRSPARSTPRRARRSGSGRSSRRWRSPAAGATSTTRSRCSPRSRSRRRCWRGPQRATAGAQRLVRNTGRGVQRAERARRPAAQPDPELEHGVRDDREAQPAAGGDLRGAADVRAGVDADARPPRAVRGRRPTRWSTSCAGRAAADADAAGAAEARARPQRAVHEPRPGDRAPSVKGFPAADAFLKSATPFCSALDPSLASSPRCCSSSAPTRSELTVVLRQHRRRDERAGDSPAARLPLPAHDEPAQPRGT